YGVAYNVGRVIGSVFPFAAGWLASGHLSLTFAIPLVAGIGYCFVVVAAWMLPETNGIALDEVEAVDVEASQAQPGAGQPIARAASAVQNASR
ncbi:MAG: MFS transporter, partial [Paraburkholderia sp.]|nr:MFS transporter [Paraburkholderia sp.]